MNSKKRIITVIMAASVVVGSFIVYTVLTSRQSSKSMDEEWVLKTKKVKFKLHRLEIDNEWFLKDLEKIVFSEDIPSLREEKYKFFRIHVLKEHNDIILFTELSYRASPANIGYFELNDYIFFVWGDQNPDNIFVKTEDIRKFFAFKHISGPPPPPQSFPSWYIKYENGRLHLIEKEIW